MPLRPLNNSIFVELDENDYVDSNPDVVRIAKEGKIILPESNSLEKMANTGKIISWGEECKYKGFFMVGKRVLIKRYGGSNFYHEGKKLRVLLEDELLAIYD